MKVEDDQSLWTEIGSDYCEGVATSVGSPDKVEDRRRQASSSFSTDEGRGTPQDALGYRKESRGTSETLENRVSTREYLQDAPHET